MIDMSSTFDIGLINMFNPKILTIVGQISNNYQDTTQLQKNLATVKIVDDLHFDTKYTLQKRFSKDEGYD